MAKNQTRTSTDAIQNTGQKFVTADGFTDETGALNTKVIATAGSDDTIIRSISATNDDAASPYNVMLFKDDGVTKYLIGTINVAMSAGFTSAAMAANLLQAAFMPQTPVDADNNNIIELKAGWTLRAGMKAAVAATKTVTILTQSDDY